MTTRAITRPVEEAHDLEKSTEESVKWIRRSHPLSFAEFVDRFSKDDNVELIDGAVTQREMVPLDHEKLFMWLARLLGEYIEEHDLGILLGSRTPVSINAFRGRLPDLLFVRKDRLSLVEQKAVTGAPDLIIELISPGDRPAYLIALETDYRTIGVSEIVFIDQGKGRLRVLRRNGEEGSGDGTDYAEETLEAGAILHLETLNRLPLQTIWLLSEPRPEVRATLARLRESGERKKELPRP